MSQQDTTLCNYNNYNANHDDISNTTSNTTTITDHNDSFIPVIYCLPKYVKTMKVALESHGLFYKKFQIHQAHDVDITTRNISSRNLELMAIPLHLRNEYKNLDDVSIFIRSILCDADFDVIHSVGYRSCPLSSAGKVSQQMTGSYKTILSVFQKLNFPSTTYKSLQNYIPNRLEFFGDPPDSRTLFLPCSFVTMLKQSLNNIMEPNQMEIYLNNFYKNLAELNKVRRIASKAVVDAESSTRQSNCEILFQDKSSNNKEPPGWITVTEYRIHMSFDMTKVMYSRGNVTEKHRFGTQLVRANEIVVDLYAGIGYYTVPALVQGKAKHVHACEWNPDAVKALKYNLVQHEVDDKATVYEGDSRVNAAKHLLGLADRVSLGLLPSSEGGWRTAVIVLNYERGGWLHVHGNVPVSERKDWITWLCHCLWKICVEENKKDWVVICKHDERVKSFAPKIDHIVADVFVGPREYAEKEIMNSSKNPDETGEKTIQLPLACGFVTASKSVERIDLGQIRKPSCALSSNGPLHHEWMR